MADGEKARGRKLWQKAVKISRARNPNDTNNCGNKIGLSARGCENGKMSFQKIAINIFETKKLQEKERELKTKDEEIDALKGQVSQEQDEKKNLQQRLDSFTRDEADTHFKLARTQEMADKLSEENKAMAECIEKLERNISHMEDRMRNLEIKASEVEKAEISLEVTKRNLESCQIDLKMKERQLEKEKEKYEKKCSELTEAWTKIKELESKMKDLNVQIRHELMKNENIERGLETIPRLREEIEEKKVKITSLEKELTEKVCLLNSSRKCARELKGKLKDVDTQDEKCQSLKEEMELLQNEVTTLKTLMSSKDVLLQQRCQKLDQAKYAVDLLCQTAYSQEEETRLKQINKLLSKLQQLNLRSISQDDPIWPKEQSSSWCGQGRSKSAMVRGTHHNQCHDDQQSNNENAVYLDLSDLNNDSSGKRKASKSSSPGSGSLVQRSASFHQITTSRDTTQSKEKRVASPNRSRLSDSPYLCSSFRSTSGILYTSSRTPKLSSKFRPSLEYSLGLNGTNEGRNSSSGAKNERPASSIATSRRSQIQISNNLSNGAETDDSNEQANLAPDTLLSKLTRKEKKIVSRLSPSQLDSILCYVIQNGDRVSVELDQKPPRYGKKQPKAVKYSGLVKFIGQIDTSSSQIESTVYVGILLDEPIGDSDGEYKGVRYMFTPPGYAKFCQLRELDTVLDVSLGVYVPINKLVVTRYQDYINTKVDSGHQVSSSSSSSDKVYQPIQV